MCRKKCDSNPVVAAKKDCYRLAHEALRTARFFAICGDRRQAVMWLEAAAAWRRFGGRAK